MKYQDIINEQLDVIDKSISDFINGLPASQQIVFDRVLELIKELELSSGKIKNNILNVKLISKIKAELDAIVIDNKYLKKVKDFVSIFNTVENLNNKYFAIISTGYTPSKTLEEIKKLNIETTISDLTENGIGSAYTDGIRNILVQNITSGGSYSQMTNILRDFIIGKDGQDGEMVKYARQIATDSINQYNGQHLKSVTSDLGLEWYMYVGSDIKTTRPFCIAMTDKTYFHESEITEILKGNINGKKVSLAGLIPSTNKFNFISLRGGYNCRHGIYPVLTGIVPLSIRKKLNK